MLTSAERGFLVSHVREGEGKGQSIECRCRAREEETLLRSHHISALQVRLKINEKDSACRVKECYFQPLGKIVSNLSETKQKTRQQQYHLFFLISFAKT